MTTTTTAEAVRGALRAAGRDDDAVIEQGMVDLVLLAHAEHDARWVDTAAFVNHVLQVSESNALQGCHAADLYLALACARGVADALRLLEREHLAHIPKYARSIDPSPTFLEELTQRLRARILVSTPEAPARIVTYSGRGPLGGWIRMSAIRLARDLAREMGRFVQEDDRGGSGGGGGDKLEAQALDPELQLMKRKYGELVSQAFAASMRELEADARTLLRMHYVDGLTIDQVGVALGMSRASGARALSRARTALIDGVRERLSREHALETAEADSLLRFVRSQIDLSIGGALAASERESNKKM